MTSFSFFYWIAILRSVRSNFVKPLFNWKWWWDFKNNKKIKISDFLYLILSIFKSTSNQYVKSMIKLPKLSNYLFEKKLVNSVCLIFFSIEILAFHFAIGVTIIFIRRDRIFLNLVKDCLNYVFDVYSLAW